MITLLLLSLSRSRRLKSLYSNPGTRRTVLYTTFAALYKRESQRSGGVVSMTENEDQTGVDLDSTPTPAQDAANSGVGETLG